MWGQGVWRSAGGGEEKGMGEWGEVREGVGKGEEESVGEVWGSVLGCGGGLEKCVGVWGSRGRSAEVWEVWGGGGEGVV